MGIDADSKCPAEAGHFAFAAGRKLANQGSIELHNKN
jgi:hypothetical protein